MYRGWDFTSRGWGARAANGVAVSTITTALLAGTLHWSWALAGLIFLVLAISAALLMPLWAPPKGRDQARAPRPAGCLRSAAGRSASIRKRLEEEKQCLEKLDSERELRGDSDFGKAMENRIVWFELLELELQDIDEQVNRIRRSAGSTPG